MFVDIMLLPLLFIALAIVVIVPFAVFMYGGLEVDAFLQARLYNKDRILLYWIVTLLNWYIMSCIMLWLYIVGLTFIGFILN